MGAARASPLTSIGPAVKRLQTSMIEVVVGIVFINVDLRSARSSGTAMEQVRGDGWRELHE